MEDQGLHFALNDLIAVNFLSLKQTLIMTNIDAVLSDYVNWLPQTAIETAMLHDVMIQI